MSITPQPQLPPPGQGHIPVYAPAAGSPGQYYGQPAVPPMPPRGRSAGFWVGVTAAIATGVIAALLVGFFIGRGTRLNNDSVQGKLTQQQQADTIAQQKALNNQSANLLTQQAKLVSNTRISARLSGERTGRREGLAQGRQQGVASGQSSGYASGYAAGYSQGQSDGLNQGLGASSCLAFGNC